MELLSPINSETLDTALAAGADAVYFGLRRLNARRGAKNYSQSELPEVIDKIHAAGAKAHLTINIDLAQSEIALAARMLQFAEDCGVDAVIVRDPAILAMRSFFPKLQFHLSTQSAVSSEAGVLATRDLLHCDRVVLARELTKEEIIRCGAIPKMEIEVFIQGALCFCASGRCLLSSWGGGRSGNRGTCASPCRVAWQSNADGAPESNPLSMHDLCLLPHLKELSDAKVASLKIEGRLKSAAWIHNAVTLYRDALKHLDTASTMPSEVDMLGNYTGRKLTSGYFEGKFTGLTDSDAGRKSTPAPIADATPSDAPVAPHLNITVTSDESNATLLDFSYGDKHATLRIPPQRIANPKRASVLKEMIEDAITALPREFANCATETQYADRALETRLLPRRCANSVADELAAFMRNATKEDDGVIRLTLRPEIQAHLEKLNNLPRCGANTRHLGDAPDTLRLRVAQLAQFVASSLAHDSAFERLVIAVNANTQCTELEKYLAAFANKRVIIALPAVAYSGDLPHLRELIVWAKAHQLRLEANSWDMLYIVRAECDAEFECGPGMAVLNSAAAHTLHTLGAQCVTASCEADREKLEALSSAASAPLSLCVFAHPALMTTRAILPAQYAPDRTSGIGVPFHDRRGTTLRAWQDGALTILRSVTPYDWRKLANRKIGVAHLECDLSGLETLSALPGVASKPFLFNYDRELR